MSEKKPKCWFCGSEDLTIREAPNEHNAIMHWHPAKCNNCGRKLELSHDTEKKQYPFYAVSRTVSPKDIDESLKVIDPVEHLQEKPYFNY